MERILAEIRYDEEYAIRLDKTASVPDHRAEFIIPSKADLKRKTLSPPRRYHYDFSRDNMR